MWGEVSSLERTVEEIADALRMDPHKTEPDHEDLYRQGAFGCLSVIG